jgi:hypothetical protein
MKTRVLGRYISLSVSRIFIADLMDFSRSVPLIPFERVMDLSELVAARDAAEPKPSWCAIFTKALAIMGQRRPAFRRAYMKFPWRRIYEHPYSVASIIIEREFHGEMGVIYCLQRQPHTKPLWEIDGIISIYRRDPLERHGSTRRTLRICRFPRWIRHLGWWYIFNVDGVIRTYNSGTYGVSVTAGHGATALALQTPLTSTLHYGIIDQTGKMNCRMTFDHRVMDGGEMARILEELEKVLKTELLAELKSLHAV